MSVSRLEGTRRSRRAAMKGNVVLLAFVALLPGASSARADVTYATVTHPTPISFFRDRLVWSAFDQGRNGYMLMTHQGGVTSVVPVHARGVPFDADLGPDENGETVAVYSRCGREPSFSPDGQGPPTWSSGRGCNVFQFNFATGRETRVAGANTEHSSEFLPSIWETRIAFARVYEARKGKAGDRAHLYARALLGTRRSARLSPGPRSTPLETGPLALDLHGRRLAFAWGTRGVECPGGSGSGIWLDTLSNRRRWIQRACNTNLQSRMLVSPTISAGQVYYARSLTSGQEKGSKIRAYRIKTRRRREVFTLPRAAALALAADAGRIFYLASTEVTGARCTGGLPGIPDSPAAPPCQLNEFSLAPGLS